MNLGKESRAQTLQNGISYCPAAVLGGHRVRVGAGPTARRNCSQVCSPGHRDPSQASCDDCARAAQCAGSCLFCLSEDKQRHCHLSSLTCSPGPFPQGVCCLLVDCESSSCPLDSSLALAARGTGHACPSLGASLSRRSTLKHRLPGGGLVVTAHVKIRPSVSTVLSPVSPWVC